MVYASRTFHIFISSTFSDLKKARNALQERVFPRLRHQPDSTFIVSANNDIPGIIRDLFAWLSDEANHGKKLVSRSLGYLAATRFGLSEDEMLDEVYETLTDFNFLEHKTIEADVLESQVEDSNTVKTHAGVYQLHEDYEWAQTAGSGDGNTVTGVGEHPLIITAADHGDGLTVNCPAYQRQIKINRTKLGKEILCSVCVAT